VVPPFLAMHQAWGDALAHSVLRIPCPLSRDWLWTNKKIVTLALSGNWITPFMVTGRFRPGLLAVRQAALEWFSASRLCPVTPSPDSLRQGWALTRSVIAYAVLFLPGTPCFAHRISGEAELLSDVHRDFALDIW